MSSAPRCRFRELGTGPEPEAVFLRLAGLRGAYFLDSSGGPEHLSRWSFLGAEPVMALRATGRAVTETCSSGTVAREVNPFDALRDALRAFALDGCGAPFPFAAGAVGFLGYDLKHAIERLPAAAVRDQAFPDLAFGFYDRTLAHDVRTGIWYAAAAPLAGAHADVDEVLDDLERFVDDTPRKAPSAPTPAVRSGLVCNMTRERYLRSVERIREYIAAGDIFQANFTRRFEAQISGAPEDLYVLLRHNNPAPFAAYLDAGDGRAVLCSSPESFLELRGRHVATRPIKGTCPRGATPEEDAANAATLRASAKDNAELAMIVDLERNDLGRVADYGSVRVTERAALERYETVFHLVATIEGDLAEGCDAIDLLKATFPGGSITGAPKIRAMEIIDELEPTARGVYTGAIGYIDCAGDADLNVAIRTMLWDAGRVTYQVGGGIVADSSPEGEYEETLVKGAALARTVVGGEGFRE